MEQKTLAQVLLGHGAVDPDLHHHRGRQDAVRLQGLDDRRDVGRQAGDRLQRVVGRVRADHRESADTHRLGAPHVLVGKLARAVDDVAVGVFVTGPAHGVEP